MIDEYTPDRCLAITISRRVCASRAFTPSSPLLQTMRIYCNLRLG
jgi:hypothetical protein